MANSFKHLHEKYVKLNFSKYSCYLLLHLHIQLTTNLITRYLILIAIWTSSLQVRRGVLQTTTDDADRRQTPWTVTSLPLHCVGGSFASVG